MDRDKTLRQNSGRGMVDTGFESYGSYISIPDRRRHRHAESCCALWSAVGLGKVSVTVLPDTRRVRRNRGSGPGSSCLAQWQEGLPRRRVTAVMEPGSQITQAEELFHELGSLGFQSGEIIRHKGLLFYSAISLYA
jgi:hypothetical protein